MYEVHFGLSQRPFGETVDPSAYVSLPSRDLVLRRLEYAFARDQGPAILVGPPGSGKTLMARQISDNLPLTPVHLTFPSLPPADLLAHLAQEFGDHTQTNPSLQAALRSLRSRFAQLVQNGTRPFLIVDDAHMINSVATFDTIRLLLNFASRGSPDLALLFVGAPEVLLDMPVGLADRLAARCVLFPFTEMESSAYVLGRLAAAGATVQRFSESALKALHRAADGNPRRLNRLADLALLIAYARELSLVDDEIVAFAAHDLHRDAA